MGVWGVAFGFSSYLSLSLTHTHTHISYFLTVGLEVGWGKQVVGVYILALIVVGKVISVMMWLHKNGEHLPAMSIKLC